MYVTRYHIEKKVCDKVLSVLHLQQGEYWDGKEAVPLPGDGAMKEIGYYSPPYPTLDELGGDNSLAVQKLAAKVGSTTKRGGGEVEDEGGGGGG